MLVEAIDQKYATEWFRATAARDAKTEATKYKTEAEVVDLESCYNQALSEIAPEKDLKGLDVVEYCQMCIYYDS